MCAPHLQDIVPAEKGAKVVGSQEECEEFCRNTELCNAASYYKELVGGNNCWLKTIAEACALPSDATDNANATLLLLCDKCTPLGEAAAAANLTALVEALDVVKVHLTFTLRRSI